MPFTPCHAAAVVPLARFGLPLSPLVIGCMMPDAPYFIPWLRDQSCGHTATGVLTVCLPAGVAALLFFHLVLKRPLLGLLPEAVEERLRTPAAAFQLPRTFCAWGLILLLLALGAASHNAWDSFTHGSGWVVERSVFLRKPVIRSRWYAANVYNLLQHGSTLAGAAFLFFCWRRWFGRAEPSALPREPLRIPPRLRAALLAGIPVAAIGVATFFYGKELWQAPPGSRRLGFAVRDWVISGLTAGMLALFVYTLVWHVCRRRALSGPAASGDGGAEPATGGDA